MADNAKKCFGVLAVTAAALTMGVSPAAAASTALSGTVNCDGYWTNYNTTRYMTGYQKTDLYVTKVAWKDGLLGDYYDMSFKVRIYKSTGEYVGYKSAYVLWANQWATFDTSAYMPKTAFKMSAQMSSKSGTCHNSWAGNLYY